MQSRGTASSQYGEFTTAAGTAASRVARIEWSAAARPEVFSKRAAQTRTVRVR